MKQFSVGPVKQVLLSTYVCKACQIDRSGGMCPQENFEF